MREAEPRAAIFGLQTMDDAWDEFLGPEHLITDLPGLFGAASLLLAAIGLYAVAAFYTARRTREFGIRMALGSSPRRTVQEVLKEGLALAAVGLGIGSVLSAAAGRVFGSFLFGVTPADTARSDAGSEGELESRRKCGVGQAVAVQVYRAGNQSLSISTRRRKVSLALHLVKLA